MTYFHNDTIQFLKYLNVSGYIASASWDCSVNVWDPYTSSSIQIYRGHSNWVYTLDEIKEDLFNEINNF